MTDAADSKDVVKKPKRKRPDGTDVGRYKNLKNWSYRKWAWEFLRRNPDFIKACKEVESGTTQEKLAVAEQYGLKEFKRYTESYKGKSGFPKFVNGPIFGWKDLGSKGEESCRVLIKEDADKVAIKLELKSGRYDEKLLEKQFRLAEEYIKKSFSKYDEKFYKEAADSDPAFSSFGKYLRLLDHLADGKSRYECAALIYPDEGKEYKLGYIGKEDMNNLIKNQIIKANEYASVRYRYLALKKGKPDVKDIPLSAIKVKGR